MRRVGGAMQSRFLTCSCDGRRRYFASAELRDLFVQQLAVSSERARVAIHAWVVMSNHIHLLVTPPDGGLERWLAALKSRFARLALRNDAQLRARSNGRFWLPGGGFDRLVRSERSWIEKMSYIHLNPVRAGMCNHPCEWPWSSARDWRDGQRPGHPMVRGPDDA